VYLIFVDGYCYGALIFCGLSAMIFRVSMLQQALHDTGDGKGENNYVSLARELVFIVVGSVIKTNLYVLLL
jgi:hypothetical protein